MVRGAVAAVAPPVLVELSCCSPSLLRLIWLVEVGVELWIWNCKRLYFEKRDGLSLRQVLAFPKASIKGLESRTRKIMRALASLEASYAI